MPSNSGSSGESGKGKEKKRVGFLSDRQQNDQQQQPQQQAQSPGVERTGSPLPPRSPGQAPAAEDYFSYTPNTGTAASTPNEGLGIRRSLDDNFNRDELTAALTEILQPEHQQASITRPHPILRKQKMNESPVEETPYSQPLRSEVEAKNRADRLAIAVGSGSVSRRSSFDTDYTGSGRTTPFDSTVLLAPQDEPEGASTGREAAAAQAGLRARRMTLSEARDLVRTHTQRRATRPRANTSAAGTGGPSPGSGPGPGAGSGAYLSVGTNAYSSGGHLSGTATPIPHDVEYIERPEQYKGGILGNLLKLYNSAEGPGSGTTTDFSSTPSTPSRTPHTTPPSSIPGTPRLDRPERPRSNLFGLRKHSDHGSTYTLAGLIGSSATLAAPGSARDMSEAVSEKLKTPKKAKRPRSGLFRQKDEQIQITIHIAEIITRHHYLVTLCKALMAYGAPTHRLEAYMMMSARVLGIRGQFLYLPDAMVISFDDKDTHTTEVKILRVPQAVDLGRLRDVHEIYKEVVHDRIGVDEAITRLEEVMNRKGKFNTWIRILLYGLASATVAPFGFEGRYIDMPIAFLLGCIVGFLQLFVAPSNELYANVFEITAAVATSFLSRMFGSIANGELFCFSALAQSSIALILPGYLVLCASLELQSHQIIAGSVRMVYALIYSLFLGYGITIGSVIYGYMDENAVSTVHCTAYDTAWYKEKPPSGFYILFVAAFALCLCLVNQAKWKQTPVMLFIAMSGYIVNQYSSAAFQGSTTLSNTLGALTIGTLANLYSRLGRLVDNFMLDVWEKYLEPRWQSISGRIQHRRSRQRGEKFVLSTPSGISGASYPLESVPSTDPEQGLKAQGGNGPIRRARKIGYGLAAAAMLPAIFVLVPSGLAVSGSLLSGITSADLITRNETVLANGTVVTSTSSSSNSSTDLNSAAFTVLYSVIQVAISISVGLSLSALIVYPLGKRRSGLFSL